MLCCLFLVIGCPVEQDAKLSSFGQVSYCPISTVKSIPQLPILMQTVKEKIIGPYVHPIFEKLYSDQYVAKVQPFVEDLSDKGYVVAQKFGLIAKYYQIRKHLVMSFRRNIYWRYKMLMKKIDFESLDARVKERIVGIQDVVKFVAKGIYDGLRKVLGILSEADEKYWIDLVEEWKGKYADWKEEVAAEKQRYKNGKVNDIPVEDYTEL